MTSPDSILKSKSSSTALYIQSNRRPPGKQLYVGSCPTRCSNDFGTTIMPWRKAILVICDSERLRDRGTYIPCVVEGISGLFVTHLHLLRLINVMQLVMSAPQGIRGSR